MKDAEFEQPRKAIKTEKDPVATYKLCAKKRQRRSTLRRCKQLHKTRIFQTFKGSKRRPLAYANLTH